MDDPYRDSVGDPQLLALHEIRDEMFRTRTEIDRLRVYLSGGCSSSRWGWRRC